MARTTGGRRGRSTERELEMRALLALRDDEGLTLGELSQACDVPVGTLAWWKSEIRRRDRARGGDDLPDFVEVVLPVAGGGGGGTDAIDGPHFEIELREGRSIRVPQSYGLARLVRELEGC